MTPTALCAFFSRADLDECTASTCAEGGDIANTNGTCLDRPAPATGFDCGCLAGYNWDGTACQGDQLGWPGHNKAQVLRQACTQPPACWHCKALKQVWGVFVPCWDRCAPCGRTHTLHCHSLGCTVLCLQRLTAALPTHAWGSTTAPERALTWTLLVTATSAAVMQATHGATVFALVRRS